MTSNISIKVKGGERFFIENQERKRVWDKKGEGNEGNEGSEGRVLACVGTGDGVIKRKGAKTQRRRENKKEKKQSVVFFTGSTINSKRLSIFSNIIISS